MINRDQTPAWLRRFLGGHPGFATDYMMYFGAFRFNSEKLDPRLFLEVGGSFPSLFPVRQAQVDPGTPDSKEFYNKNIAATSSSQKTRITLEGYYTGFFGRKPGLVSSLGIANEYLGWFEPTQDTVSELPFCSNTESSVFVFGAPSNPYGLGSLLSVEHVMISKLDLGRNYNGSPLAHELLSEVLTNDGNNASNTMRANTFRNKNLLVFDFYVTSSNLEWDPNLPPPYRSLCRLGESHNDYSVQIDYAKRKLHINPCTGNPNPNPNCLMVSFLSTGSMSSVPVYMFRSNTPIPGLVGPLQADRLQDSFHALGFTASTDIEFNADARSKINKSYVIVPTSYGTPASGNSYTLEVSVKDLVNSSLLNHLPLRDSDNNPSRYFTEQGTLITEGEYGAETTLNIKPIAFPFAQGLDSDYLYFITMDDDLVHHLNVMKLGHVNSAQCVMRVDRVPIQMLVVGTNLYMAHHDSVEVYDILSATTIVKTATYTAGILLDSPVRSITYDYEIQKIWVGHEFGVTDLSLQIKYGADVFTNSTAVEMRQQYCCLQASNNILTWVNDRNLTSTFQGLENPSYATVFHPTTGFYHHFRNRDVSVSRSGIEGQASASFQAVYDVCYGIAPRSNGDIVLMYSGSDTGNANMRAGVFRPSIVGKNTSENRIDGTVFSETTLQFVAPSNTNRSIYFLPMIRVSDHKYVVGYVHPRLNDIDAFESTCDTVSLHEENAAAPRYCVFFIDDSLMRISRDPRSRTTDNHNNGDYVMSQYQSSPANQYESYQDLALNNNATVFVHNLMHALRSYGIIRYKQGWGLMFAGRYMQAACSLCYNWDNLSQTWVLRGIGKVVGKPMHTGYEALDSNTSVRFNAGVSYTPSIVYRATCFPSTSTTLSPAVYGSCAEQFQETITIPVSHSYTVVDATCPDFQCVDSESVTCVRLGQNLEVITSGLPTPTQVLVVENAGTFVFHSDNEGSSVSLTYVVVRDSVGGTSW